jgi:transcriptional regulator with XRE-family HTH domain
MGVFELHKIYKRVVLNRSAVIGRMNERGVTFSQLAKAVRTSRQLVSAWINGATPSDEKIEALAAYFECSPDDLVELPEK